MSGQRRTGSSNGDDGGSIPAAEGFEVVRALIAESGKALRTLAPLTDWSFQSWSFFQRGKRPTPVAAMKQLLTITGVTTDTELGRRATALVTTYQSAPAESDTQRGVVEDPQDSQEQPPASAAGEGEPVEDPSSPPPEQGQATRELSGKDAPPHHATERPRHPKPASAASRMRSNLPGIVVVLSSVLAVVIVVTLGSAPKGPDASPPSPASPVKPTTSTPVAALPLPSVLPAFWPVGPPDAIAVKTGARAEFYRAANQIALYNTVEEGATVAVKLTIDGRDYLPVHNVDRKYHNGPNGRERNPPRIIDLQAIGQWTTLEFRACTTRNEPEIGKCGPKTEVTR